MRNRVSNRSALSSALMTAFLFAAAAPAHAETGWTDVGDGLHLTVPVMPERPKTCDGDDCAAVAARSQDVLLDQHGECRFVDTPGASNKAFVPAKTAEEFSAFIGADVPGMTKSTCCRPTTVTLQSKVNSKSMDIDLPYARHGDTLRLFTDVAHPNEICSVVIETGEKTCEDFSWTEQIDQEYSCVGQTWIAGTMEHSDPPADIEYRSIAGYGRYAEMPAIRAAAGFPVTPEAPNAGIGIFYAHNAACFAADPAEHFSESWMRARLETGMTIFKDLEMYGNAYCEKTLTVDNTHPKVIHWGEAYKDSHGVRALEIWNKWPWYPMAQSEPHDPGIEDYMGLPMGDHNRSHWRSQWFHGVTNAKIADYLAENRGNKIMTVDMCDGGYYVYHNHKDLGPYDPAEPFSKVKQRFQLYTNCKLTVD